MGAVGLNRWTAFWLSAFVPGSGQLLARDWSAIGWFVGAGCVAAIPGLISLSTTAGWIWLLLSIACGLVSAEHAKRCWERKQYRAGPGSILATRYRDDSHGSTFKMRLEVDLARPAEDVWREVADVQQFLTIDPFHVGVELRDQRPRAGTDLVLEHCALGVGFFRWGRFLTWREGAGYSFSDLSVRGPRRAFPHVFYVEVAALSDQTCRLSVDVKGRWTTTWIPVRLGRAWVNYVHHEHLRLLTYAL